MVVRSPRPLYPPNLGLPPGTVESLLGFLEGEVPAAFEALQGHLGDTGTAFDSRLATFALGEQGLKDALGAANDEVEKLSVGIGHIDQALAQVRQHATKGLTVSPPLFARP